MRVIVLSKTHAWTTPTHALWFCLSQTIDVFSRSALEGWGARADPSFTMSNRPSAMSAWPEFCMFPRIASPAAPLAPQNAKFTDRTEAFGFYDLCVVEPDGIEPTTSCLQSTRSTN